MEKYRLIIAGNMGKEEEVISLIKKTALWKIVKSYDPGYVEIISSFPGKRGVAAQLAHELDVPRLNFSPNTKRLNKQAAFTDMQRRMCLKAKESKMYGGGAIIVWNETDIRVAQMIEMCKDYKLDLEVIFL